MMVLKRNQVVVISLVLLIIVAGFINYSYNRSSNSGAVDTFSKGDMKIGEPAYVENFDNAGAQPASAGESGIVLADDKGKSDGYFAETRHDKQTQREQDVEKLDKITKDQDASKETREKAYTMMMGIIKNAEDELLIEKTLKAKGFEEIVALVKEGDIEIVVKAANKLSSQKAAQILDVVTRQTKARPEDVHIITR